MTLQPSEPWLEEWMRRHDADLARWFARRGVRPEDVEELRQDTWVALWRQGDLKSVLQAPWAYVRRIAASKLLDLGRRAKRHESKVLDEEGPIAECERDRPDEGTAFDLLVRLEPMEARALALRFQEGLSVEAIAERMEAKVGTVKSWLHRGRARLRALIEEEER